MTDDIDAIRARHEACGHIDQWPDYDSFMAHADRATLLRLLDAALEEIATWHSVFPDIAPDRVLPNRSKLEAELDAAREELDKEQVSHLKTRVRLTRIREASELIAGPVAWLDSWAKHVSNCKGGYICTCGLVLARQEALGALEALTRAQGESS
jgi:hypothetical protein